MAMEAHPKDITRRAGLSTGPIPIEPNISEDYFLREREKIFRRAWLNVARIEDVPNPGDYRLRWIPTLGVSVLVVRGRDNEIRVFQNMCRHRGNEVVRTEGGEFGCARGFSCGYHGWTYDLSGKLVLIPDEDQFFGLDKGKLGLPRLDSGVWEGFVFASFQPEETLKDWLGELYDAFGGYFEAKPGSRRFAYYRADINVNWKVVHDAFIESYHAPFLHGKSYPDQIGWNENFLGHALGAQMYKNHRMLSIEMNPESDPSPIVANLLKYSHGTVWQAMGTEAMSMDTLPPGINPTRDDKWGFDIYMIFPNLLIAPSRSMHYVTYHYWPMSADRTIWETDHYIYPAKTPADRLAQELTKAFGRDVQREDLITLENTQTMLRSGAMTHMPLQDQEVACRHNYEVVERFVNI